MKQLLRIEPLSVLLSLLALGCQAAETGDSHTGTETNWLKVCQSDAECGELACECGVCTRDCRADTDCDDFMGSCVSGSALSEQCEGARAAGLCLERTANAPDASEQTTGSESTGSKATSDDTSNDDPSSDDPSSDDPSNDDPSNDEATNATSEPTASDASTVEPGPTSSATEATDPTEPHAEDTTLDSSNPSDGGGWVVTAVELDASSGDAGSDTAPTDAGASQQCESLPPAVGGCCYTANDCAAGEHCYAADCEAPAAGRCVTPPVGNCYADSDCAEAEHCENGSLARCGTLGPDQLGTCVADCDFDSCHPERCDEPGEPCCDPLPGDGPNYCNETLSCLGNVCTEQTTTTPEAQARQSCEATGGTWEYETCGHYVCGLPNDCSSIIPGCNCGAGRSFDTLGCAADERCGDGAPPQ